MTADKRRGRRCVFNQQLWSLLCPGTKACHGWWLTTATQNFTRRRSALRKRSSSARCLTWGPPDAHLQICATSKAWEQIGVRVDGTERLLGRMHLPVGGRRFRPTLEDMVEFLVTEKLAQPKNGWKEAVTAGREKFRKKQLRAAIRRDPETARDALADLDLGTDS
jgi:hypothetical protein